jgi:hypothetical protein
MKAYNDCTASNPMLYMMAVACSLTIPLHFVGVQNCSRHPEATSSFQKAYQTKIQFVKHKSLSI